MRTNLGNNFAEVIPQIKQVVCPACKGPGRPDGYKHLCENCHRIEAMLHRHKERRKKREKLRESLQSLLMLTIPKLYHGARLHHLPHKLQQIMREYDNVLLFGGAGVGKTYAGTAELRRNLSPKKTIAFVSWESFLIRLRDFDHGSEDSKLQELKRPDILLIDDLGTSASDYSGRALYSVIDDRLNQCKRTIITANCTPEELEAMYGPRTGSRLSTYKAIQIGGKDRRRNHG